MMVLLLPSRALVPQAKRRGEIVSASVVRRSSLMWTKRVLSEQVLGDARGLKCFSSNVCTPEMLRSLWSKSTSQRIYHEQ